jgi:hypothetical protein
VNSIQKPDFIPGIEIEEKEDDVLLKLHLDKSVRDVHTQLVSTQVLGYTIVSEAVFESRDGTPYVINTDFFGSKRNEDKPGVGPFESLEEDLLELIIW